MANGGQIIKESALKLTCSQAHAWNLQEGKSYLSFKKKVNGMQYHNSTPWLLAGVLHNGANPHLLFPPLCDTIDSLKGDSVKFLPSFVDGESGDTD